MRKILIKLSSLVLVLSFAFAISGCIKEVTVTEGSRYSDEEILTTAEELLEAVSARDLDTIASLCATDGEPFSSSVLSDKESELFDVMMETFTYSIGDLEVDQYNGRAEVTVSYSIVDVDSIANSLEIGYEFEELIDAIENSEDRINKSISLSLVEVVSNTWLVADTGALYKQLYSDAISDVVFSSPISSFELFMEYLSTGDIANAMGYTDGYEEYLVNQGLYDTMYQVVFEDVEYSIDSVSEYSEGFMINITYSSPDFAPTLETLMSDDSVVNPFYAASFAHMVNDYDSTSANEVFSNLLIAGCQNTEDVTRQAIIYAYQQDGEWEYITSMFGDALPLNSSNYRPTEDQIISALQYALDNGMISEDEIDEVVEMINW